MEIDVGTFWVLVGVFIGIFLTLGVIAAWLMVEHLKYVAKRRRGGTQTAASGSGSGSGTATPKGGFSFTSAGKTPPEPLRRPKDTRTEALEKFLDDRETRMAEMLGEMRELILRLTEIVAKTDSASGEANERFQEARRTLDNLEMADDASLGEIKAMLVHEIDKVVTTNEFLKRQLIMAQNGMASQQKEIETLKSTVRVDSLSQLPNRAAFDERLKEAMYRLERTHEAFSLLMLDIDFFKRLNDTNGHVAGDKVLKGIAKKIKECLRQDDFVARYGGEEFVAILPATPSEEALAVAERIRHSIENAIFVVDGKSLSVTISGGVALCSSSCEADKLIAIADRAMYESKRKGKNRISLGGDDIKEAWTTGEVEDPDSDKRL